MIAPFVTRPAATLAGLLLVTAGLGASALEVRVDNTAAAWLPDEDDRLDAYRSFRERFGEDGFLFAATGRLDLDDPTARRDLLALGRRLAAVPGVAAVRSPLAEEDVVARARADLPRRLAVVADAVARAPGSFDLRVLQARLEAALPSLLLEPEAALPHLRRAQEAALAALGLLDPEAPARLTQGEVGAALADLPRRALPAVFWWAFARGAEVRAAGAAPALLADLPRADAAMGWVLERDPALFAGGPHRYFALRYAAAPRGRGGDPDRALPHFEALEAITGGEDLLPRVLRAELHAPSLAATPAGAGIAAVRSAQRAAWEAFSRPLRGVLAAPLSLDRAFPLENAVARRRAAELLADPGAHGVIPPDDAALPPAPPPAVPALADGPLGRHLARPEAGRAAFLVVPADGLTPPARAALVEDVEEVLAEAAGDLGPLSLSGPEALTDALDRGSRDSFGRLFPLVALLLAAVLWAALRSLTAVAGVLLVAGVSAVWTVGLLAAFGRTLNMVVVVVPAILAVVTTAAALHLLTRYLDDPDAPPGPLDAPVRRALWLRAAGRTLRPCLLTAATTAMGFASLGLSRIPPVRDLGVFAAFGVLASFGLTFVLLPTLLALVPGLVPRARGARWWTADRARALAAALGRRRWWVLAPAVVLAAAAAGGLTLLRVESNVLAFFPPDHPLPRAVTSVEEDLLGVTPLELWLSGPPERVLSGEALEAVDRFLGAARARPLVRDVVSPLELPPGLDPEGDLSPAARAALLAAAFEAGAAPAYARAEEGRLDLRVTLACRTTSSDAFGALVADLRGVLADADLPGAVEARLTGEVPLLVRVQALLVDTQLRSFGVALALVTGVLLAAFRSPSLVALSLVPNALPILVTLGAMGFVGIPLDTATVTVAGIALGLVVDDTIHFLDAYAAAGGQAGARVAEALRVVGRPVVTTSLAVAVGFGAFALSPFRPTFYFGVLIALTALSALVCDLLILPALLHATRRPLTDSARSKPA